MLERFESEPVSKGSSESPATIHPTLQQAVSDLTNFQLQLQIERGWMFGLANLAVEGGQELIKMYGIQSFIHAAFDGEPAPRSISDVIEQLTPHRAKVSATLKVMRELAEQTPLSDPFVPRDHFSHLLDRDENNRNNLLYCVGRYEAAFQNVRAEREVSAGLYHLQGIDPHELLELLGVHKGNIAESVRAFARSCNEKISKFNEALIGIREKLENDRDQIFANAEKKFQEASFGLRQDLQTFSDVRADSQSGMEHKTIACEGLRQELEAMRARHYDQPICFEINAILERLQPIKLIDVRDEKKTSLDQ